MATPVADLARRHATGADVRLEAISKVAPLRDNPGDKVSFGIGGDQRVDLVELVGRDELQDFHAYLAGLPARQGLA